MAAPIRLADLLTQLKPKLPDAEHELIWLAAHYLHMRKSELAQNRAYPVPAAQEQALRQAVRRRQNGEPLQYITGLQPFWDFELIVSPAVLIPRWDSETVIEQALKLLPPGRPLAVADICTGSGAYALSIKHSRPEAAVTGADISAQALHIARQNAAKYDLQIDFRQGDLLAALPDTQYDLIVSNPPYIRKDAELPRDVRQEPALALFGGADGLAFYRRLAAEAGAYLKPGGYLLLEIGCDQAAAVRELLQQNGWQNLAHGQDLAGRDRWVQAQRPY